ncbi:MAG: hypothetical protein GIW95_05720 [Candidatus Eremiobacteraeota bacterium]|nr:hypothetical protein [Candidatus Eremiobacteraeota bacterium]
MIAVALATALSISLNGSPLHADAPPLERNGRVLLPARAVFDALGAAVDYRGASQHIDIRRGKHFVRVTLGSDRALVDGRTVRLDAPARVYDGRTYVPLRFVAQALGASVEYDGALRVVTIADANVPSALVTNLGTGAAKSPGAIAGALALPSIENRHPAQGETVTGAYPSISASVQTHGGAPIDDKTVRMFLDGRDVTDRLFRSGDTIGYTPAYELGGGAHEVTVQGADQSGARFSSTWNFRSTFAYAPGQTAPNVPPAGNPYYDRPLSFYVNGGSAYGYGGTLQVLLIGPPGGSGYVNLCGYGAPYPLRNWAGDPYRYYATIPLPTNIYAPSCYVNGYFYGTNGFANYLSLGSPIVINTLLPNKQFNLNNPNAPQNGVPNGLPTAKPFPIPSPSLDPSHRRLPMGGPAPVPAPTPMPTPHSSAPPRPIRTPQRVPSPRPTGTERPERQPL